MSEGDTTQTLFRFCLVPAPSPGLPLPLSRPFSATTSPPAEAASLIGLLRPRSKIPSNLSSAWATFEPETFSRGELRLAWSEAREATPPPPPLSNTSQPEEARLRMLLECPPAPLGPLSLFTEFFLRPAWMRTASPDELSPPQASRMVSTADNSDPPKGGDDCVSCRLQGLVSPKERDRYTRGLAWKSDVKHAVVDVAAPASDVGNADVAGDAGGVLAVAGLGVGLEEDLSPELVSDLQQ